MQLSERAMRPAARVAAPPPDAFDRAFAAGRRWLTTGNVPVKVGVIISFFGVAFLLKYAVDRNLLVLPMELRLLGIAAGGLVLLAIGWCVRRRNAVYALSLQGGGIGVLYLTIFAAFRLYLLLPASAAFVLLVVLVAAIARTWPEAAALLTVLMPAGLVVLYRERLEWPLRRYRTAYLAAATALVSLQLIALLGAGIDHAGDPAPWPYVPVFNPFDSLTLAGRALGFRLLVLPDGAGELATDPWSAGAIAWAAAAFLLTTVGVVRGMHHLAHVTWSFDALLRSVSVQAALSIYWGTLAFGAMVFGARRASRNLWLGGTVLMAAVVAKLFLVDLGNTGTVARIVSFLGVGILLLVVGWFAPAPPRQRHAGAAQ